MNLILPSSPRRKLLKQDLNLPAVHNNSLQLKLLSSDSMLLFTASYLFWTEAMDLPHLFISFILIFTTCLYHLASQLTFGWTCTYITMFLALSIWITLCF